MVVILKVTSMNHLLALGTMVVLTFCELSAGFRSWRCTDNKCVKEEIELFKDAVSIGECKIRCLKYGGLWPKPTILINLGNDTSQVDLSMITFEKYEYPSNINSLLVEAQDNFLSRIKHDNEVVNFPLITMLYKIIVRLEIYDPSVDFFFTGADESYKLQVFPPSNTDTIQVDIKAQTFLGLHHGLETLSQLFFYDDFHQVHKILHEATIDDRPVFTHRGIILDTARSYISVENILSLLNVMATNKLNTFHWHITDSQSFPYVSLAYPELSRAGAYSEKEVYTQNDIKKIVRRAQSLGIRIIPEFDAPAHVGEGWDSLGPDLITCFKWQPWREYCVEPPCGQLDPTNERVYEILEAIFKEYVHLFHSDLFHLGGDEVNLNCWRSTSRIREWIKTRNYSETNSGYYRLWGEYQDKVLNKLKKIKADPHPQAVLWTSTLTQPEFIEKYIRHEDYIIQIWTSKSDSSIKTLVENKYRIIFSNYDELYLDCGGASWVGREKSNWCSPYIGWQNVYNHSPYEILKQQGLRMSEETKNLVLGSEVAVWTEQIDNHNLHVRLWPRAAALGERLWSNPNEDWSFAQFRMNHHKHRLTKQVPTEQLQPHWCYQNDGFCD